MVRFLKDGVRLGADASGACLEREGVPVRHRIAIQEAIVLSLLGYTGSVERTSGLLSESFDDGDGEVWLRRVLDRWGSYLGEGSSRPPDLEFLRHIGHSGRRPLDALRREAAPAAVTWLVTLGLQSPMSVLLLRGDALAGWPLQIPNGRDVSLRGRRSDDCRDGADRRRGSIPHGW